MTWIFFCGSQKQDGIIMDTSECVRNVSRLIALCRRNSDGSATSMAYVNFLEQSKAIYDTRAGTCMKYYIQSGEAHIIQTNNMTPTISTKSLRNVRLKCIVHVVASVFTDGNKAKPDSSE